MADAAQVNPTIVVLAKRPVVGAVKTRLIGALSPAQAAAVHDAMLRCILDRIADHVPGQRVLALSSDHDDAGRPAPDAATEFARWRIVDQGTGDLGARLDHVWRMLGAGPIVFLGADSPDVPGAALRAIVPALDDADAAVGPVSDGGYWTLAARRYLPALLHGIDWGTANVYHQTTTAAARAGVSLATLPAWYDVDQPDDLVALRRRLRQAPTTAQEPALLRLAERLRQACEDQP